MKILFVFLLIPALSIGAQVLTPQDTTQAVVNSLAIEKDSQNLFAFAYAIDKLAKNGYAYQVSYTTTPIQAIMTPEQQQDIYNYYQSLKLQLQTDFGKLP